MVYGISAPFSPYTILYTGLYTGSVVGAYWYNVIYSHFNSGKISWDEFKESRTINDLKRPVSGSPPDSLPKIHRIVTSSKIIEIPLEQIPFPTPTPSPTPPPQVNSPPTPSSNLPPTSALPDQSLWDLACNRAVSWLEGFYFNGVTLDPSTVETLKDMKGIAGGFALMFFIIYISRREPKTDYYHYDEMIIGTPPDVEQTQLKTLEEALAVNPLLQFELFLAQYAPESESKHPFTTLSALKGEGGEPLSIPTDLYNEFARRNGIKTESTESL